MNPSPLLYRYLMRIQSFQHWIQKQSHLWWVSVAAPLSRLLRKQQSPVNLSVPSWVRSVKSTDKTCRLCFHPKMAPSRPALQPVDQNITPLVSSSHGPTDEQRTKVTAIVATGTDMSTTVLACVDVLFTEDEMARCNTSGTNGFQQLDSTKLGFLVSVLRRKFDSPCFSEQCNQIAVRINTKCRGKRRTLIHRLKKTSLFWKHWHGTISLSFAHCKLELIFLRLLRLFLVTTPFLKRRNLPHCIFFFSFLICT